MVLAAEDVWFKYEEKGPDIVRGLHMTVRQGEFVALLGGNGTGKSTTLRLLSEGLRPYRGTVRHTGRLGVLPQNPQALFVKKTVREDLFETFDGLHLPPAEQRRRVEQMVTLCRLTELLDRHPYDLSGGEQQRAALAKVMLLEPDILLMDEPTKGLDAEFKQSFAAMVRSLLSGGVTVLMVSHDVEFCARYAHRCALFFDGSISAEGTPRAFFGGNSFYTTSADRMARGLLPHAVTAEDVMAGIGGTVPPEPEVQHTYAPLPPAAEESADWKPPKLPWWRKALAAVSGAVALVILWMATRKTDLTALVGGGKVSAAGWQTLATYGVFLVAMFVLVASIGRRAPPPVQVQTPVEKRKLSRRTVVASVLILLMIPVTLVVCVGLFGRTHYYITALLVMLECMLPFFMVFEGRRPQARELTIIAVLCALGVAGRAAFFMLPQFKPVMALTIIAGVAFGGETGFLVGGHDHAGQQRSLFAGAVDTLPDVQYGHHRLFGRSAVPQRLAAPQPGRSGGVRRHRHLRHLRGHHEPRVGADLRGRDELADAADVLYHRLPHGLCSRLRHGDLPAAAGGAYAGEAGPHQGQIRAGRVIQRPMDTHRKAGASVTDTPAFLWRPAGSP